VEDRRCCKICGNHAIHLSALKQKDTGERSATVFTANFSFVRILGNRKL
jgi:formate hydrogenlyase subunit 6/NADH:ubiquinone oxidoreductase subunit I